MQSVTSEVKGGIHFKRKNPLLKKAKKTRAKIRKVKVNQKLLLQKSELVPSLL